MSIRARDAFDLLVDAYEKGKLEKKWDNKSAFANCLGASQATASAWLNRRKKPSLSYVLVLSREFGIDPSLWAKSKLAREATRAA